MTTITYEEFERVNLRSGTIVKVEEFPRAKKPAFKVWADLEFGMSGQPWRIRSGQKIEFKKSK